MYNDIIFHILVYFAELHKIHYRYTTVAPPLYTNTAPPLYTNTAPPLSAIRYAQTTVLKI